MLPTESVEPFSSVLQRLTEAHDREINESLAEVRTENSALRLEIAALRAAAATTRWDGGRWELSSHQPQAPGMVRARRPWKEPAPLPPIGVDDLRGRKSWQGGEVERATTGSSHLSELNFGSGPRGFHVRIMGARNLRRAEWSFLGGGSGVYCLCEVEGKLFRFQTSAAGHTAEPLWKEDFVVQQLASGDRLSFSVLHRRRFKVDSLLGKATLPGAALRKGGFDGDLPLKEAGEGVKAYLHVRVLPLGEHQHSPEGSEAESEDNDEEEGGEFQLRNLWQNCSPSPPGGWRNSACMKLPDDAEGRGLPEMVQHTSAGWLRHCVSPPGSPYRLAWDLFAGMLILYDSLVIPLQVFRPGVTTYSEIMDVFTLCFWTVDMALTPFVGFYCAGVVELRFEKIAWNYVHTWLLVDVCVVLPDWYFTISSISSGSSIRLLRLARFMKIVRLVRLLRLGWLFAKLTDRLHSESTSIILNIFKVVVVLLFINHFIACIWYLIADTNYAGQATWLDDFKGSSWDYLYLTSLHWSITQFTPASMEVQPQNSFERGFTVTVVVFALVIFSYLVGSITNSLTQLRSMQEEATRQFSTLRRYLKQSHVPLSLSVRIQRYLEHAYHRQRSRASLPKIWGLLSEQLQNEFECERSVPHLVVHPLFHSLNRLSNVTLQRLAVQAISRRALARGDRLFYPGELATHVYFPSAGQLRYVRVDEHGLQHVEFVDSQEDWISEPVLWTPGWEHLGTLLAHTEAELLLVDGGKFGEIINLSPPVYALAQGYAARFLRMVNQTSREELSDIAQGEIISATLRGFISETQAALKLPPAFLRRTSSHT